MKEDTLGLYDIQLKPGEVLPRYRKLYYLSGSDSAHLKEILSFYLKHKIIVKAPMNSGDGMHLFGSPSYLIAKKDPDSTGRLIIDYRKINSMILQQPNILPTIHSILHSLRNSSAFSCFDLANAYNSFRITESSQHLTQFICPLGTFRFRTLPTGLATCCETFQRISNKMIHEAVVLDDYGKPIFDDPNTVRTVPDPLPGVLAYFDDILVHTPAGTNYEETIETHFNTIERLIQRLHFHGAKLNFVKSQICKYKISFLGWWVCNNYIMANPKRIEKLLNAECPNSSRGIKSFLGLCNSLRLAVGGVQLEDMRYLTPLTSSTRPFKIEQVHKDAFERLKRKLTEKPLFCKIVHPSFQKILYTDASSAKTGSWSSVLCQVLPKDNKETFIPDYLTLDDPVHRLIFDSKLQYRPCPILRNEEVAKAFLSKTPCTEPPLHTYLSLPNLGYTDNELDDSFFISIQSLQYLSRCKALDSLSMRQATLKTLNKGVLRLKLNSFVFDNNMERTKQFLHNFKTNGPIDNQFLLIEAFSYAMHRPVLVISSLEKHKDQPFIKFNFNITKPHWIVGAYAHNNRVLFLPYYIDKNNCFDLRQVKDRLEVVAYCTKTI